MFSCLKKNFRMWQNGRNQQKQTQVKVFYLLVRIVSKALMRLNKLRTFDDIKTFLEMNSSPDFLDENRDEDKKKSNKNKLMFKIWCYAVCYAAKYYLNNWYKITWWQR